MQEYCLLQDLPELCCYTIWAVFIYPAVISLGFAFLINTVLKDGQLLFNLFSSVPCNWGKLYIQLQRLSNSRHHLLNCLYVQEVIVGCCSTLIYCELLSHKLWWIQASGKGFFFFFPVGRRQTGGERKALENKTQSSDCWVTDYIQLVLYLYTFLLPVKKFSALGSCYKESELTGKPTTVHMSIRFAKLSTGDLETLCTEIWQLHPFRQVMQVLLSSATAEKDWGLGNSCSRT